MIKAFLTWGASSLRGHIVVALVVVALPLFLRGLIISIGAAYPTGDLGTLIVLPVLAALALGLFVWYYFTLPRMRRRPRAKEDAPRDL
jgi:uncharacterized BrkB/YihY/UPF0761 family membrane protein